MSNNRTAVLDCGKYPSEENCKIKLSAPESQVDKLIELGVYHACKNHGCKDSPELKKELRDMVEFEESK